jgi:serine/threonine protein kinase
MELRELISRMLEKDHEKRISWEQIFSYKRININKIQKERISRTLNEREHSLEELRRSLIEVNRSSAKIEEFAEKDNVREQSEHMTRELIEFEQILGRKELKDLEKVVFRLKVTLLTVLHCNHKIESIIK